MQGEGNPEQPVISGTESGVHRHEVAEESRQEEGETLHHLESRIPGAATYPENHPVDLSSPRPLDAIPQTTDPSAYHRSRGLPEHAYKQNGLVADPGKQRLHMSDIRRIY